MANKWAGGARTRIQKNSPPVNHSNYPGNKILTVAGVLGVLAFSPGVKAQQYSLHDLGTLPGGISSGGVAINACGDVTGYSYIANGGGNSLYHAFISKAGIMTDLGSVGNPDSYGQAINARGQVAGYMVDPVGGVPPGDNSDPYSNYRAFISNGQTMTDLGTFGGSSAVATAINVSGQVTGSATMSDSPPGNAGHAFISNGTTLTDLGTLGGSDSYGSAINVHGQITGSSAVGGDSAYHAFITNGNTMTDLGALLNGGYSWGLAINDRGQVTGSASAANGWDHAFISDGATMTDLGTLGGPSSQGIAINASGQVTGYADAANNVSHAFISNGTTLIDLGTLSGSSGYSMGKAINVRGQITGSSLSLEVGQLPRAFIYTNNKMTDLNTLVSSDAQALYTLTDAVGINDRGQIVANGYLNSSQAQHAFLLNPIGYRAYAPACALSLAELVQTAVMAPLF